MLPARRLRGQSTHSLNTLVTRDGVMNKGSTVSMYKKLFKIHRVFELALFSLILIGCATASKDVSPTYISHALYQSYDCNQLMNEAQRIQTRIDKLGGSLDDAARNDILVSAASAILFWPALIAIGGMKGEEAD